MSTATAHTPAARTSSEWVVALAGLTFLFASTSAWWALALWPVQDGPDWLERTRYVCFGVTESGLPDLGGWIGLIGGPLGMLAILFAGWANGCRALPQRARESRVVAGVLLALVLGSMLLVAGAAARVSQARVAVTLPETSGTLPAAAHPRLDREAPPLDLLAHDGVRRSVAKLRGKPVLLTFAFAHCETVCPLVVQNALDVQQRLRADGRRIAVLIVTLDPWRDTPSRLSSMAKAWGLPQYDAWVLGGWTAEVEAVLDAWDVPRSRDLRTGEVTHPPLVYVIDAEGRIAFTATGGTDVLAALVERL